MKKVVSILMLMLFLISNSGASVTLHWCGGKLSSVDFFSSAGHSCSCGKKAMKKNCCKDSTVQLKTNDTPVKSESFTFKILAPKFLTALVNQMEIVPLAQFHYSVSDFYHPPTIKSKAPLYLLDRVFLI